MLSFPDLKATHYLSSDKIPRHYINLGPWMKEEDICKGVKGKRQRDIESFTLEKYNILTEEEDDTSTESVDKKKIYFFKTLQLCNNFSTRH